MKKPNGYWTYERCKKEALKHKNKTSFRNSGNHAYYKAHQSKWIDDLCKHMTPTGSIDRRFIYEIADHNLKIIYIGLSYDPYKRFKDHKCKGAAKDLIEKGGELKVLTSLLTQAQSVALEDVYVKHYHLSGYKILNRGKTGGLGGKAVWSLEKCTTEALKYNTRTSFARNSSGAYLYATLHNHLDVICKHMIDGRKLPRKWRFANCLLLARKYKSKQDFIENEWGAYQAARKHGWLTIVCDHMRKK